MRWAGVIFAGLSGCSALFDLDAPTRQRDDASVALDDADVDASMDTASGDVGVDGPFDPASCPMDYAPLGGSTTRFRYVGQNMGFLAAAADCADDGPTTHLAVLSTMAEVNLVDNAISQAEVWIGLSDLVTNGTFLWVTAEDTMGFPPASGGPWQNAPGSSPCVSLKDATFETRDCGTNRPYLCECDPYPDDSSRY